ncbi:LOW QUALITY PROTEIN: hypothetical protein KIPB_007407 [Kipferlia bialata]|uniref:SH3 domain-containing protein n=1 Tax=Kipferlia bialata TaxID=797122 RepID=A0A9K3CYQ1_9EUKA|nr:LOW QUALITY PROTEIN: hypothetical protein KIPB_007407 [Kipferlia bialata]
MLCTARPTFVNSFIETENKGVAQLKSLLSALPDPLDSSAVLRHTVSGLIQSRTAFNKTIQETVYQAVYDVRHRLSGDVATLMDGLDKAEKERRRSLQHLEKAARKAEDTLIQADTALDRLNRAKDEDGVEQSLLRALRQREAKDRRQADTAGFTHKEAFDAAKEVEGRYNAKVDETLTTLQTLDITRLSAMRSALMALSMGLGDMGSSISDASDEIGKMLGSFNAQDVVDAFARVSAVPGDRPSVEYVPPVSTVDVHQSVVQDIEGRARVIYGWDRQEEGELTVTQGQEVQVLSRADGWWHVVAGGEEGIVPGNRLEWLGGAEGEGEAETVAATLQEGDTTTVYDSEPVLFQVVAEFDREAEDEDELPLSLDCVLEVLEVLEGWYRGRDPQTGAEGMFPDNYVRRL